jgi:hypothetical protein
MKIYFYTLSNPNTPDEIRYVGKTTQKLSKRLGQHINAAKRAKQGKESSNHNTN